MNVVDNQHRSIFYSIQYEQQNGSHSCISHDLALLFKVTSKKVYSPMREELKSNRSRFILRQDFIGDVKVKSATFHGQFDSEMIVWLLLYTGSFLGSNSSIL